MEEDRPTQANRDVPRSRTPKATFSTPDQPTPAETPAERARRQAKAAPPVTFQPPASDSDAGSGANPQRRAPARGGAAGRRTTGPRNENEAPGKADNAPGTKNEPSGNEAEATDSEATTSGRQGEAAREGRRSKAAAPKPRGVDADARTPAQSPGRRRQPAAARNQSDAATVQPDAAASQPGAPTGQPGSVTNQPGAPTNQPGATSQPGEGAAKTQPEGAARNQPGVAKRQAAKADRGPAAAEPPEPEKVPMPTEPTEPESTQPKEAPAHAAPGPAKAQRGRKTAPVKAAPAEPEAGAETPQAAEAPAVSAPQTPAEETPTERTPVERAPAGKTAAEKTPVEKTPAGKTAAEKTPAKKAPAKRTPRKRADAQLLTAPEATTAPAKPTSEPQPAKPIEESTPIFTELSAETTSPSPATTTPSPATLAQSAERAAAHSKTRTDAWAQLIADPGHAPELLALAAVQTIGPRAQQWATRTREAYPTASDKALARLATRQFARFGNLSSIFGAVAGSYAPIALLGAAALTHAELILHLAAAYGLDPTDEARATDLLVLTRVHPTRADAESALRTAKQPAYEDSAKLSDAAWRLGRMVAAQSATWAGVRLVNRFFPGTSLLVAALTSSSATETVANRANSYFSQANQESGSTV